MKQNHSSETERSLRSPELRNWSYFMKPECLFTLFRIAFHRSISSTSSPRSNFIYLRFISFCAYVFQEIFFHNCVGIYFLLHECHIFHQSSIKISEFKLLQWVFKYTRVGTLIVQLFIYNWYKIDTCFEVLLSFTVVTSIVYNLLPAIWKS